MGVNEHRRDNGTEPAPAGAPRLYFAAPLFSDSERVFNEKLTAEIERIGYTVFLPQRDGGELRSPGSEALSRAERRRRVFATDYEQVVGSDVLLFVLDGRVPDEGAAVELGIAYAHRVTAGRERRLVGLHTDSRSAFFHSRLNPMIGVPLDFVARTQSRLLAYLGAFYRAFVPADRLGKP